MGTIAGVRLVRINFYLIDMLGLCAHTCQLTVAYKPLLEDMS